MHPPGSTCPPPTPPTSQATNNLLHQLKDLLSDYNNLVRLWDCSQPSVRAIFSPYRYLNRADMEKLVDRAEILAGRLGDNFAPINPSTDRSPREEYDMLERLCESTENALDNVREELQQLSNAVQENHIPRSQNATINPQSRPNGYSNPSEEVLQLRGENSTLRRENANLGQELEEARDYIRVLERRNLTLENKLAARR
ncbi:hypothetical protein N431DRAFT_440914 [Stipitochalara longipes BDJ]|nr:hypothetical protein N431DRAFT_440914 [Stipitochalara longipes BDJ]